MSQMSHISFFKHIFYVCDRDLWSECTAYVDVSCSVRVAGHGCVLSVRRSTASGECSVASMGADERHRQCQLRGVAVWQRCGWATVGRAVTQVTRLSGKLGNGGYLTAFRGNIKKVSENLEASVPAVTASVYLSEKSRNVRQFDGWPKIREMLRSVGEKVVDENCLFISRCFILLTGTKPATKKINLPQR